MHVVHLLRKLDPAAWGGTETALQRLLDGLQEAGVTPVIYCPRLASGEAGDPLSRAGYSVRRFHAFVPVLGMRPERKRDVLAVGGNLLSFDLLAALWRERKVDVIHSHTLGRLGGIALRVAKQRQIPFVVSIHGGVLDLPQPLRQQFQRPPDEGWEWGRLFGWLFQSRALFRDAQAILTCNENEARLLREQYPTKRVVVQPHGVPTQLYQEDHRKEAQAAFPQIAGRPVLLSVGRLDTVKNQAWLLEELPELVRKYPQALLVLVGACTEGAYDELLRRRIRELGLEQHVLLTGGLPPNDPRLIGLLQRAAALVLPSRSETFGLVLLEAWAAGTVVISSRTSGALALIEPGHNGWLFDLEKPAEFHEAAGKVLSDRALAGQMARCGAEKVAEEYSLEAVASRMKSVYEQVSEESHALRNHS